MESRKRLIGKLSITLVVIVLVLTFFSNTIYNLNVAGVVVGFETSGVITNTYRGFGFLEIPETQTTVFSEHTGRVEFLVEDGDEVDRDAPLFDIHFVVERSQILDQLAYLRNRHHSLPWVNVAENSLEIRRLQDMLAEEEGDFYYSYTQYAPSAGVVEFLPGMDLSNRVMEGQAILRLSIRQGRNFELIIDFPESLVPRPGPEVSRIVRTSIPVLDFVSLDSTITDITAAHGRWQMEMSVNVPDAVGGERVEVVIEDIISAHGSLLPNYAIRSDDRGNFIFIVRHETNAFMGSSYFVERVNVVVTNRGDRYTDFTLPDELEGPIILQSDRPIREGDRIRMIGNL